MGSVSGAGKAAGRGGIRRAVVHNMGPPPGLEARGILEAVRRGQIRGRDRRLPGEDVRGKQKGNDSPLSVFDRDACRREAEYVERLRLLGGNRGPILARGLHLLIVPSERKGDKIERERTKYLPER